MNNPFILSISDLRHSYGRKEVLHGLNIDIERGCIFALLGPNGGGKTTLFRILSTLIPPHNGSVHIDDMDIRLEPAAVRSILGVLFQHPALDQKLRVIENLRCGGHLYGLKGKELEKRIKSRAEAVGITEHLHDPVEELSGGMQRRVEIAKALLPSPKLLLLDEPSTGLDPVARAACWEIYRELQQQGITIVLTTHLMEEAEKADRVAILHQGEFVADAPPAELCHELGEFLLIVRTSEIEALKSHLEDHGKITFRQIGNELRILSTQPHDLAASLHQAFGLTLHSITIARPTLEDVFAQKTGVTMSEAENATDIL